MKNMFTLLLLLITFTTGAQTMKGSLEVFDMGTYKLHIYTSAEAMADVSAIIEGDKELVILEQPSFVKSIREFNEYTQKLNKPVSKIIANYHTGGLAEYPANKVVMMKGMPEFEQGEIYSGMLKNFANIFGEAMDLRPHKKTKTIEFNSKQQWAGVNFVFTAGAKSDFPAASIFIGDKAYYSHFAPAKVHFNSMQIPDRNAVDAVLTELKYAQSTQSELFFGSHGTPAKIDVVHFQIEYLEYVKMLLDKCDNADTFSQQLIAAYPQLTGATNVRALAKGLYPEETANTEKEKIRMLLNNYTKSISDVDRSLARTIWADTEDISIINGTGQYFGFNSIFNDFIVNSFGELSERKLSSVSEVINVYGDMAYIQFYWVFDRKDKEGIMRQNKGRETLICRKINDEWKIYHIHYSGMPRD
ncbi:nuclear transport factor 2 family protein [Parabacteroides sp. PF5-9]|uniref:YybH family protein n=1 Tax=Parabacteroides sp. PF5-9 TaxID=1742404 RepID=UPI0024766A33|nr:nuclear transport factor 2 family protein [Parabacteroides sp. PF5-9]MDH6357256.1 ketosteroid isomerase-like protein [Parabacteroides sp. PF5-9]